jgi:DNA polymerase-4
MAGHDGTALRKIIHIDMDAFFASVEQRDDPALRGRPVAVGGSGRRGVVAAASYEARQFGVHSAMPSVTAMRRCASLVFVKPRFERYRAVSRQIHGIFSRYSDLIEPLSLDEAYLDVSEDKLAIGSATQIAQLIRAAISSETGLTASAGVSYNKFLAKIASNENKPDGIFVITPRQGADFVASLPVRRFHGVGPRTAERMARLGLHVGADLSAQEMAFLTAHFGKAAGYLYRAARGQDHRPVRSDRIRKSVGGERTFGEDLLAPQALTEAVGEIAALVWRRVERCGTRGRTVTLKVKYTDFRQITRSLSCQQFIADQAQFSTIARLLLGRVLPVAHGVRLLGLALSGLAAAEGAPQAPAVSETAQGCFDF